MEIHYSTSGFLEDASYTADLLAFLKKYEAKFIGLEELKVELREIHPSLAGRNKNHTQFSIDKKKLTISLEYFQYRNEKGKITGKPNPYDVYQTLKFVLDKAVDEYRIPSNK